MMRNPWTLTAFSGILIVFAFPPWNIFPLVFVALIPWLFALHQKEVVPIRGGIKFGIALSIVMTLGGYYWIAYAAHHYGGLPWTLSILVLLGFSIFNQVQFIFFGGIWTRILARINIIGIPRAVLIATIYTLVDSILPKLFMDTLGYSLYVAPSLRQWASIGGVSLLTFGIVFSNALLFEIARSPSHLRKKLIAVTLVFWGIAFFGGNALLKKSKFDYSKSTQTLQISAIQGNIGDLEKIAAESGIASAAQKVLRTFLELSKEANRATPAPDFIVWPETTYPSTFGNPWSNIDRDMDQTLIHYVTQSGTPILFGGYDTQNRKEYNSLFALFPDKTLQIYHKTVLLPFGEYIPGFDENSIFKSWFPQMGFFGRGPGPQVLKIPLRTGSFVRLSPIICYEALIPEYVRGGALAGSQLILNITNDSWFGPYGEPDLHLALTVFRGIETGLPQLRSTNTGLSASISPDGEIVKISKIGEKTVFPVSIPILETPPKTILLKFGNWFPGFLAICFLINCLFFRQSIFNKHS